MVIKKRGTQYLITTILYLAIQIHLLSKLVSKNEIV